LESARRARCLKMAASNTPITDAGVPQRHVRGEKTGVAGDGKDIVAQVVLAGIHKRVYLGTQSLALTGASQALTVPAGTPSAFADIYAEGSTANDYARYWHGSTPSATVGKKLKDDQEVQSADPGSFNAINGSGTVTLRVEYYSNG
jgi:hypothetical protein